MKQQKFTEEFATLYDAAVQLTKALKADALLLLVDGRTDWERLHQMADGEKLLLAADAKEYLEGSEQFDVASVTLDMADRPIHEKLSQALLECLADDILAPGASVVAVYSGFEAGTIDSLSVIDLGEHLGRLTARDLRQLETRVPLDTLKLVVDLALEIGREGREGKPVGTMFVVGDTRNVLAASYPAGFDPVRGYGRKERNLNDRRVQEGIKEIAQVDGAFVVAPDGTVAAAARYLDAPATGISLSKGLGSRHWAAAAISRRTKAVAVAVSETNGTVRIFNDGEMVLRIEPFRRPLKWKELDYEPPGPD